MNNTKNYNEAVKKAGELFDEFVKMDDEQRKAERRYNPYNWLESDRDTIAILFAGFLERERKAYNGACRYCFTNAEMYWLEIALEEVPHKNIQALFECNRNGEFTVSDWHNKSALINRIRELGKAAKERALDEPTGYQRKRLAAMVKKINIYMGSPQGLPAFF